VQLRLRREAFSLSLSEAPLVIGLFLARPIELLAGRVIGSALVFVAYRRQRPMKAGFNTALVAAGTAVAVTLVRGVVARGGAGVGAAPLVRRSGRDDRRGRPGLPGAHPRRRLVRHPGHRPGAARGAGLLRGGVDARGWRRAGRRRSPGRRRGDSAAGARRRAGPARLSGFGTLADRHTSL